MDMKRGFWDDAPVISSYSRRQACEDGVLVDVTGNARACGFAVTVAMTFGLWAAIEAAAPASWTVQQRLDLALHALRVMARGSASDIVEFRLPYPGAAPIECYALCGPGDDAGAVVTMMLQGED